MLGAVQDAFSTCLNFIGEIVRALIGTPTEGTNYGVLNGLLPIIGFSISLGIVGWGIKSIKSLVWGF